MSLAVAAFLGVSAVALGAFGAHGLKDQLAARNSAAVWETAVLYHLVHAACYLAAALATSAQGETRLTQPLGRARVCWLWGTVLFSGSLYSLALGGPRWMGPITPLGGILFIIGWVCVGLAAKPQASST